MLDLCKELKIENDPNYIGNLLKLLMKEAFKRLSELSIILEFMTDITDIEE